MTPAETLAAKHPHGTRVRYMTGCKCGMCRAANSRYECDRAKARANGDWNGVVPATRARARLRMLAQHGIGRRLVEEISGVGNFTLQEIKNGRKKKLRARTERRILAVTTEARGARTLVQATPVWAQIDELLTEGCLTKGQIARGIGNRMPALQIGKAVVTAETAMRVARLHAKIMAGRGGRRQAKTRPVAQGYRSRSGMVPTFPLAGTSKSGLPAGGFSARDQK